MMGNPPAREHGAEGILQAHLSDCALYLARSEVRPLNTPPRVAIPAHRPSKYECGSLAPFMRRPAGRMERHGKPRHGRGAGPSRTGTCWRERGEREHDVRQRRVNGYSREVVVRAGASVGVGDGVGVGASGGSWEPFARLWAENFAYPWPLLGEKAYCCSDLSRRMTPLSERCPALFHCRTAMRRFCSASA